ncbi:MAG: FAD-binding oxidoreductase [Paracoccus sp. (in: a-proteobacteria)]|uniref:NAD(P)/FAD-dependent oxidoreductase n=1 Tax=Paracoccus sp. TaxID=267 RepID=UPI0026E06F9E|nr:FAD-binding oxidoreductase [Paracoccus sp. (in: a-proteobacteria)]MDO5611635.1 FAD-binding oxidoreductase [Paracoccus sp. (in: a-proteobacteria)]
MASVTVMGAGIFGLACAWELVQRGARVRVLDARGVGAGASGGQVGALSPHAPENWNDKKQFQLDSLLAADAFWSGAADAGGRDPGFARVGRVQPLTGDPAALAPRLAASADRWPQAMRVLDAVPPGALVPRSDSGLWLWDGLSGRIAPRAAVACLAAAITARGGVIETGDTPGNIGNNGPVIWATGWEWLRDTGTGVGQKGQSALLAHAAPDAPQVYAEGLHIVPHADGTLAIGSTSERDFTDTAPDEQALELVARARVICPVLADAPLIGTWAGIRPRAASRAPLLGAWPGRAGHFVANGGFKIGFGMAPGVARVMADLLLEGRDAIPEAFRFYGAGDTPIT